MFSPLRIFYIVIHIDYTSVGIAIGRCLESEADLPSIQSLSQNFRAHNTCSDGLTGTAANRLEPGYFSRGGKSVVILPNHDSDELFRFNHALLSSRHFDHRGERTVYVNLIKQRERRDQDRCINLIMAG